MINIVRPQRHPGKIARIYLREFVKYFPVFKDVELWEEYFWDTLITKQAIKAAESSRQLNLTIDELDHSLLVQHVHIAHHRLIYSCYPSIESNSLP